VDRAPAPLLPLLLLRSGRTAHAVATAGGGRRHNIVVIVVVGAPPPRLLLRPPLGARDSW